ncbi:mucin-12 [Poecilia reticulata]|uniref:mucin-12 n=1 Tax=Poecilia reticulata TaxID=8081 RepID=UPI0007E9DB48|nr:PREDICTED: mucin-12 [Poecilia reticulata]
MAEAVVPGAFNRTVIINVVIRENYIPEYDNPSSNEYKTFVGDFLSEMKPKYQEVPFFKDIIVTGLSRGGPASTFDHTAEEIGEVKAKAFDFKESTDNVNVAHDVVLEVNNGNHTGQYKEGFQKVEEVIGNLLESGYVITSSTEETDVDEEGLCKRILQDSDIAEYFSNFTLENGTIVCRSRCDPEHNETIECHNKGTCSIFKGLGEICICENVNSIWYLGEDCSWPIQKVPFYAGLSVTLAVLLVAVVTLVAYAVVNKQKHTKKKDVKQKLVNQWLDDDYEWSRAASPIGKHGAKNGSVMYGNQQAPFTYGSNRFNPSERMFSLPQNLHTHDSSFPNPGYGTPAFSPSPNTDFRFNLPMRILRPETRGSLDV